MHKIKSWTLCVIAVCGFIFIALGTGRIEISQGYIVSWPYFMVGLLHGISIVLLVSRLLKGSKIGDVLRHLGRKSMSIMLFHFTVFKLVSSLLIILYGMNRIYLASHPIIYEISPWWSLVYLAVGLCVPVLFDSLIDRIRDLKIIRGKE